MEWVRFIHVLGAVAAGYYILLPYLAGRLSGYTLTVQVGYLRLLYLLNRVGQYILIVQFLTGGYLISQKAYSYVWIAVVIVVFLLVGGLAGMMARPLRQLRENVENGRKDDKNVTKLKVYSALIAIGFIALIVMMAFPVYRAV